MMPTKRRRGLQKSREGCQTCRTRRKKCDETKPCCGACQRLKLQCIYTKRLSWSKANQITYEGNLLRIIPSGYMLVFTSADIAINYSLSDATKTVVKPGIFGEYTIKNKSIHEDYNFQNLINTDKDAGIQSALFKYYVEVVSKRKVFSDSQLNEFRSVIIPNSVLSPSLFKSIIALSASNLIRNSPLNGDYYSKLSHMYKTEAINSLYNLLDHPSKENMKEIIICEMILCTLELGERSNDHWISYLKQSCLIFQSIEDETILESKPLLFCYRYFALRYILLLTTYTNEEYTHFVTKFPLKIITQLFNSDEIDYMFGCSPRVLYLTHRITELKNDFNMSEVTEVYEELSTIRQVANIEDPRLWECSQSNLIAAKLYFEDGFVKFGAPFIVHTGMISELLALLTSLWESIESNMYPTWTVFMLGIYKKDDDTRIKIMKIFENLESVWPMSSVSLIYDSLELIWKSSDLNPDVDWREVLNLIGFKLGLT